MIFSFLWNGKDKVTRLYSINSYEEGGIKMTDIESLVKVVRLAWLKRIFSDNESTWKFYLLHLLRNVGGLLLFKCNYAMNDLSINSVFYRELLECWLEFRNLFLADKERHCITWNNKDIRIDQARPGVLGIRYPGLFQFRYMVFFGQNSGIKYSVFPEF